MNNWRDHQEMMKPINFLESGKRFINEAFVPVDESQNETGLPREELEKIKKIGGLEGEPSFLGSASMGAAFQFGNKVLKLTTDVSEARAASLLVGKNHPNVYTVLFVGQRSEESRLKALERMTYVVVYEYLDWPNRYMVSAAEQLHDRVKADVWGRIKRFYKWKPNFLAETKQLMSHIAHEISLKPDSLGEPINEWHEIYPKLERISTALSLTDHQRMLFEEFWLVTHGSMSRGRLDTQDAAVENINKVASGMRSGYFNQLASALTFLFNNGIMFDDLKSSNIMEKNNQVAIIDVGYSSVSGAGHIPTI